jgi:hypothetical protein
VARILLSRLSIREPREGHVRSPYREPAETGKSDILEFESEAEFRDWARTNVADWESFVDESLASMDTIRAWRAAGNTGLPPGYLRRGDYERQRALLRLR